MKTQKKVTKKKAVKKVAKKATKKTSAKSIQPRTGVASEGRLYSYTDVKTKQWLTTKAKENKQSVSAYINGIIQKAHAKDVKKA